MSLQTPTRPIGMPRRPRASVRAVRALEVPGSSAEAAVAPAKPPVTATTRDRAPSGTTRASASARWSVSCGTGTVMALPGPPVLSPSTRPSSAAARTARVRVPPASRPTTKSWFKSLPIDDYGD